MRGTLTEKILKEHLVSGTLKPGEEIGIRIDQTLLQDATGTMACLEFEALGKDHIENELAVIYVDHNTIQTGFENMDDHRFLQSFAKKYGMYFSKPGNGICHQLHLERFATPGKTLLGADSHTPTAGALGMLAIGAGGLEVAVAMALEPFFFRAPFVVGIKLYGKLKPAVSAKDVILELLRRLSVKGATGKVLEYFGEGLNGLSVPERATIANMGTETGALTSIFPSDKLSLRFLKKQGRESSYRNLYPDPDAEYQELIEIDLSEIEPMVALPSSPDNVVKVKDAGKIPIAQVNIGSCTNSSFRDLYIVSEMLKGKKVAEGVSLTISPGSRQVLQMLAQTKALGVFYNAGARVFEPACNGCIGIGSAPATGINSLRTYNRNFKGRSGTKDDRVFLASPETACASAITGFLTDPREFINEYVKPKEPRTFPVDDNLLIKPENKKDTEIIRGPNIKPLEEFPAPEENFEAEVLIKLKDNISTDDILPGGEKIMALRSNLPAISEYAFSRIDPNFFEKAKKKGSGIIVAGENYGQGSSREHAALSVRYLGVKAVIALSFARIHRANLINFGVLPLLFENPKDIDLIEVGDKFSLNNFRSSIEKSESLKIKCLNKNLTITLKLLVTERERKIILAGSLLNLLKQKSQMCPS